MKLLQFLFFIMVSKVGQFIEKKKMYLLQLQDGTLLVLLQLGDHLSISFTKKSAVFVKTEFWKLKKITKTTDLVGPEWPVWNV